MDETKTTDLEISGDFFTFPTWTLNITTTLKSDETAGENVAGQTPTPHSNLQIFDDTGVDIVPSLILTPNTKLKVLTIVMTLV